MRLGEGEVAGGALRERLGEDGVAGGVLRERLGEGEVAGGALGMAMDAASEPVEKVYCSPGEPEGRREAGNQKNRKEADYPQPLILVS